MLKAAVLPYLVPTSYEVIDPDREVLSFFKARAVALVNDAQLQDLLNGQAPAPDQCLCRENLKQAT